MSDSNKIDEPLLNNEGERIYVQPTEVNENAHDQTIHHATKIITTPAIDINIPDTLLNTTDFKNNGESGNKNKIPKPDPVKVYDTKNNNVISTKTTNKDFDNESEKLNESSRVHLGNLKKHLRTKPASLTCPYCKKNGVLTRVTKNCSVINIICSIISTPIFWALLKCCRGKDYNCYNASHVCSNCNKKIADYSAC
jgi:hypothetical protein